jgi:tRNA pseudouridine38-40 synthase
MLRTFRLLIAYDGTGLAGWQRQPRGVSVQGLLEDALAPIAGGAVTVNGAGRTDAGVHATGQVASVTLDTRLDAPTLRRALNAVLPPAVRVLDAMVAAHDFHARFGALSKTYQYRILLGSVASPFACRYAWHLPHAVDTGRMADAATRLEGTHDFAAFQSTGSDVTTTVRTVIRSRIEAASLSQSWQEETGCPLPAVVVPGGTQIVYTITGSGFLRHMVRAIVGTLVEIGRGRMPVDMLAWLLDPAHAAAPHVAQGFSPAKQHRTDVAAGFSPASRGDAGPTAPARGLCLVAVAYAPAPVAAHR